MGHKDDSAGCYILQNEDLEITLEPRHFDSEYWQDKPGFHAVDGGRGGSIRITVDGRDALLRQYRRGGIVQKISTNRYVWLGKSRSRPWREWHLLKGAREAGLPVPQPLAAFISRSRLTYRAAIITAYVPGTQTLAEYLVHSSLDYKRWYQLGLLIKKMQVLGFRHADLNANNLLLDQELQMYIIDFDKGRRMKKLDHWQWSALYRLQRSLLKIDRKKNLHFREDDWQALMDGYQTSS